MKALLFSLAILCAGIQLNAQTNSGITMQINNWTNCPQYFTLLKFDNSTCITSWSTPVPIPPLQSVIEMIPSSSHIEGAQVFDNPGSPTYWLSIQTPPSWSTTSLNFTCTPAGSFPECAVAPMGCGSIPNEACWGGSPASPTIDIVF